MVSDSTLKAFGLKFKVWGFGDLGLDVLFGLSWV